jgi:diguanylate cyclase (GGDEF)-like protein/PAS domain S-box-containing protein/putative nucleotidyltransferase with HDIG domain
MSLINSIPDLIFYKDFHSVYVGCNSAFGKFAGREENELIGLTDLDLFDREMAELFRATDKEMMKQSSPRRNEEIVTYPDGTKVFLETLKTPYFDSPKNVLGLIGISRDITERKKRDNEILFLTYHDALTGLYNRTFFEEERMRLDTQRQLPLSVIIGDINGLKLINDSFGHAMGDELLKKVAEVIKNGCRNTDTVARLAGDEFIILMPNTDINETEQITKRIKALALKEKIESIDISVSFGYETKTDENVKIQDTFKMAEDHMYKKKLFESPSMMGKTIETILNTLHEKNKREEQHSHRVSKLCGNMAEALGLPEGDVEELETAGLLHDIGKIAIEDRILNKPDKLTENERNEIMRHPEIGYRILRSVNSLAETANYILAHHEHWDGSGYPKGSKGNNIPLQSRIIAIADAYDAMTSERTYCDALSEETAIEELQNNAGIQFQPELVSIFIEKVLRRT